MQRSFDKGQGHIIIRMTILFLYIMLNKAPNVFNYFAQRSVSCIKTELEPGMYVAQYERDVLIYKGTFTFKLNMLLFITEGRSEEVRNLVNDFILAWQCVKNKLLTYRKSLDILKSYHSGIIANSQFNYTTLG